ncbi:hypothetical protein BDZ91DRAFT_292281 [Kalaharituber pfeilii]|nr:hypothetical protein BDZ91DRAFT_292281 [Kalaharituber pfeilii]
MSLKRIRSNGTPSLQQRREAIVAVTAVAHPKAMPAASRAPPINSLSPCSSSYFDDVSTFSPLSVSPPPPTATTYRAVPPLRPTLLQQPSLDRTSKIILCRRYQSRIGIYMPITRRQGSLSEQWLDATGWRTS